MSEATSTAANHPPSDRTTVKRGADRAVYDREQIRSILDAGHLAHVGVSTDHGPIVLPMVYGRIGDTLYLHGSAANAMLRAGASTDICVTVTLVDGLVFARSAFHHSMNYRSVVVRGEAGRVTDPDEVVTALRQISDHVAENWDGRRPPTDKELRATMVLSMPLTEASAKVRAEGAIDDDADVGGPRWAGVVPLETRWAAPVANADVTDPCPDTIAELEGRAAW